MRKLSKINEGLWDGIIDRGTTGRKRKEDMQSPFFGKGIEYKLYEKDGNRLFDWKETQEILKENPGWRLPTINDMARAAGKIKYISPLAVEMDKLLQEGFPLILIHQEIGETSSVVTSQTGEIEMPLTGMHAATTARCSICLTGRLREAS